MFWLCPPSTLWRGFLDFVGMGRARPCRRIESPLLKIGSDMGLSSHYCWRRRAWVIRFARASPTPPGPVWCTWSCLYALFPPEGSFFRVLFFCWQASYMHSSLFDRCSICLSVVCSFLCYPFAPPAYARFPLLEGRAINWILGFWVVNGAAR